MQGAHAIFFFFFFFETLKCARINETSRVIRNPNILHMRNRVTAPGNGRSRHTKVVKNGTSCSSLGTQIYGVELGLVDPVSG